MFETNTGLKHKNTFKIVLYVFKRRGFTTSFTVF